MTNATVWFAADYAEARRKFRDAATAAGARLVAYENPRPGPAGETLTTDVARLGPADARRLLVTISGTHGAEGFCGSAIQIGFFAGGLAKALPPDTALLAVHAINPYGFAWLRRVTEDNVDLNRNFVDFAKPLPANEGYVELADAICPSAWAGPVREEADARLDAYGRKHGAAKLQHAVSGGQYSHPGGIFYGGAAPTWSRGTIEHVLADLVRDKRRVAIIDFHTGLGPCGHGEVIAMHRPGSPAMKRAQAWWGEEAVTSPLIGSSKSAAIVGDMLTAAERDLAPAEVTAMALEFGTVELRQVLDALRADAWLHRYGDPLSPAGRKLKQTIRDAFYCDRDDWKKTVWEQGAERQRQALAGLAA